MKQKGKQTSRILLIVIILLFALSFLMPILLTITNSFMSEQEISSNYGTVYSVYTDETVSTVFETDRVNLKFIPDMVTFKQYITVLFMSPEYLLKFWNSVFLVVPIIIFQILTGLGAAYAFTRFRSRLRNGIFFFYIMLMLMPFQVTLVPNYLVAKKMGILDNYMAIILPGIFSTFGVFLLTKFMRRIPFSLIESAQLDGAGEWAIFTKICIPLCKSAITSVAILLFIDYWNMVEQPLIFLSDPERYPLSVYLSQINEGEISLAFAVAVIYMIPAILVFLYGEEYLVEGIACSGGIKG